MPYTESEIRERTRVDQQHMQDEIDDTNAVFGDRLLERKEWIDAHTPDAILKIMALLEKIQTGNMRLIARVERDTAANANNQEELYNNTREQVHALISKINALEQELQQQKEIIQTISSQSKSKGKLKKKRKRKKTERGR